MVGLRSGRRGFGGCIQLLPCTRFSSIWEFALPIVKGVALYFSESKELLDLIDGRKRCSFM